MPLISSLSVADQGHILAAACIRHGEDPTIPSDETLDGAVSFIEFWRVNLQGEHKGANLEMVAVIDSGRVLDMTFHPNPGAVGPNVRGLSVSVSVSVCQALCVSV